MIGPADSHRKDSFAFSLMPAVSMSHSESPDSQFYFRKETETNAEIC